MSLPPGSETHVAIGSAEPPRLATPLDGSRSLTAARLLGLEVRIIEHGHVTSVEEAAESAGVQPCDVVKTLVVRRGPDDYVLVLVPGDRSLAWPKLRSLLGVNRLSLPDADEAKAATGYERGTITPLGVDLPVIADSSIRGRQITLGSGVRNVALGLSADDFIAAASTRLAIQVADVT